MTKSLQNKWKRICSAILAAVMVFTMLPVSAQAGTSSDNGDGTFRNPVIYSDVPDIDMIRVGDTYYMVSTTMHLSPGCPIMKSTDLVNWEIVNYVYDILGDGDAMSLRNGQNMYGNGQWAASLKYHDGMYYVAFNSNTTGKAYIYSTDDIERGSWTKTELNGFFHDMALFFDDAEGGSGKAYILYGGGEIKCMELEDDLSAAKLDTERTLFNITTEEWENENIGTNLAGEGTHIQKIGEYYYVFNICWPEGSPRTELCHRTKSFPDGAWEHTVILSANFENNGVTAGVAQGGVIDTVDGSWYGFMFQDHGAVGRTPVLTDCTWKDGWPMLGKNGDGKTVEQVMNLPVSGGSETSLVKSDEFYNDAEHRVFAAGKAQTAALDGDTNAAAQSDVEHTGIAVMAEDTSDGTAAEPIELFTNGDVETGDTTGWTGTPGEAEPVLAAVTSEEPNGSYSLYVSERKTTGAGACQDISGKLELRKTYTISGRLKYTEGPDTKQFYVTIQNGPDYNYRENVISIHAEKNQWTEFSGTYTPHDKSDDFPFDSEKNYIFVETPWTAEPTAENDWMSYYLDDFSMTAPDDNLILNGSFEKGIEPWTGMEDASVAISTEEAQDGQQSAVTTNRTACAQGPCQDLSNKLTPGNTYTITSYVKYMEGVDEKTFNLTIQNGPDYNYRTILGSVTAKKGEWTQLKAEWTMPEDAIADQNYLFFETPWVAAPTKENDLMDFYVDHVSIAEKVNDLTPAKPGENDYNGSNLDLVWQWNHNPDNNNWSLTDRSGWLRLTTGSKTDSILNARNTLTQRTYGPVCSGRIKMDISHMKTGDVAGLAAFSYNYGYIAVKKGNDGAKLVMVDASANSSKGADAPVEKASVDCTETTVYLKEEYNFAGNADGSDKDKVRFYYSFDGTRWSQLGDAMQLSYELKHFMGSRFAIFNYAARSTGGYVDVDYFRVSDQITGAQEQPAGNLTAAMSMDKEEISGVPNSACEAVLTLDQLEPGNHSSLQASVSIPDGMHVEDVEFHTDAISGETDYTFKNQRLNLSVTGTDVAFTAEDKVFATIRLKLDGYVDADKEVELRTDYIMADRGMVEYNVDNCKASVTLKYLDTQALAKKLGYGNPIMTQEFGADPYAITYDGRVYVYMTADDYQYNDQGEVVDNDFGYIKSLRVVSSSDLVNWTDHGEIAVAGEDGAAKWAAHSWAPAIAYKQINGEDKFFLYFANDASGIGVLQADTPLGPWTDPIGGPLLTGQTPGCQGVVWCFDPAVLVDDDGSAYIYFGGGVPNDGQNGEQLHPQSARVAKLGEDMISIEGEAKLIDAPCMFEDSGIFKYNDTYYYSYCSNFIAPHGDGYPGYGTICYMVSDDPMGPFTYAGEIFENPAVWFGVGGNNHHATFVFEGESYFIYHAQTVSKALGIEKGYRSTHIDKIELNSDGSIKPIKGTYEGIPQLHTLHPYERIDAETIAWNAGIKVTDCAEPGKLFADYNSALTNIQEGDWTSVSQLDFGEKGAAKFQVYVASAQGGTIDLRLDSPQGESIGTVTVAASGSDTDYQLVTCDVKKVTGIRNVFLVFHGPENENIMNVDYYQFVESGEDVPVPGPSEDEKAANAVIAKIDAIGTVAATEASKAKIDEARAAYDALTAVQKELVTNYSVLTAAEAKYKELTESGTKPEPQPSADQKAADTVIGLIQAIGTVDATDASRTKISGARTAYDKLTDAQKKLVTNYNVLAAAEAKYAQLTKKPAVSAPKKNKVYTVGSYKYKVTNAKTNGTGTVMVTGSSKKKAAASVKSVKIADTVKIGGYRYKVTAVGASAFKGYKKLTRVTIGKNVTSIGQNAFNKCSKLKKITIKSTRLKKVGKNAIKGIYKKAVLSCPKKQLKKYKKLFKASTGYKKTMKIK